MKIICLIILVLTLNVIRTSDDLYSRQGQNWDGLCKAGKYQSPINIVEGLNTTKSTSTTTFNYKIPKGERQKMYFDGDKLYIEIELGTITHVNDSGAKEIYKAKRIEIHVPSEHYITKLGSTPRAAVEIQIFHDIVTTDLPEITNQILLVRKSVVSILLYIEGDMPDLFLDAMGISGIYYLFFKYYLFIFLKQPFVLRIQQKRF